MIRRIVWEAKAVDDFDDILAYLSERSPDGASTIERKMLATLDILAARSIGRPSRVAGLFEKAVVGTRYTISYGLDQDDLIVVRVIHQRRDWPEGDWPAD